MESLKEIQAFLRDESQSPLVPIGHRTKSGLAPAPEDGEVVAMEWCQGIETYDPSEFLITARAGTPVREISQALQEHGQYLPFDPLLVEEGATLGGTVASGLSGQRQLLHGSLRDFVMEVQLIDGVGELVRGGGKVVKNAAGFDLPKLMVGSYGRLGVLTEVTLKVLPRPAEYRAFAVKCQSLEEALKTAQALRAQPLPIASLEISGDATLYCEFAGMQSTLESVAERARAIANLEAISEIPTFALGAQSGPPPESSGTVCPVYRLATTPSESAGLAAKLWTRLRPPMLRISSAGSLIWLGAELESEEARGILEELSREFLWSGVAIVHPEPGLHLLGSKDWVAHAQLVKQAMDPKQRFLSFQ